MTETTIQRFQGASGPPITVVRKNTMASETTTNTRCSVHDGLHRWVDDRCVWCDAERRTNWLPIDTAPKNGMRFLSWNGEHVFVGLFVNRKFFVSQGYPGNGGPEATHWMPLPQPPDEAAP